MANKIKLKMKQVLILSCTLLLLISCSNRIDYYHGYIFSSKENKPLKELRIEEDDNLKTTSYTDEKGYFKIPETNGFGGNLIIYDKNNSILDTIWTVYSSRGEKLNYRFINGRKDTLFITLPNNN
jgi:hypothetical protein